MSTTDVGTVKLFENDKVVLWDFVLQPGEATPCHTHAYDYVWYVIEGATLEVFDAQDRFLHSFEAPTGAVFTLRLEGDDLVRTDDASHRVPATHWARNVGTTPYREILVETKRL